MPRNIHEDARTNLTRESLRNLHDDFTNIDEHRSIRCRVEESNKPNESLCRRSLCVSHGDKSKTRYWKRKEKHEAMKRLHLRDRVRRSGGRITAFVFPRQSILTNSNEAASSSSVAAASAAVASVSPDGQQIGQQPKLCRTATTCFPAEVIHSGEKLVLKGCSRSFYIRD